MDDEDSTITVLLPGSRGITFNSLAGLIGSIVGAVLALLVIVSVCVLAVIHKRRRNIRQRDSQLSIHNLSDSPHCSMTLSNQGSLDRRINPDDEDLTSALNTVADSSTMHLASNMEFPFISLGTRATLQQEGVANCSEIVDKENIMSTEDNSAYSGSPFPLLAASDSSMKSFGQTIPSTITSIIGGKITVE